MEVCGKQKAINCLDKNLHLQNAAFRGEGNKPPKTVDQLSLYGHCSELYCKNLITIWQHYLLAVVAAMRWLVYV